MALPEEHDAHALVEYFDKLISERAIPVVPPAFAKDEEVARCCQKIMAIRKAMLSLADGDLSPEITSHGFIVDLCKNLQTNLRHLIRQVHQAGQEGYTHSVDFIDEFSTAFNSMVAQLEASQKALRQKEEALVSLAIALQEEVKKHTEKRIASLQELQQREKEFKYQAQHDPLTGVFNRRSFSSLVEAKLQSALAINRPCCIAILDVDSFKQFNDTYGHGIGDNALKHVVQYSTASLRQSDCMGRYGGEEFVFLFFEAGLTQGTAIAERIRCSLEKHPFVLECGKVIPLTVSIGVCEMPENCSYAPDDGMLNLLIDMADKALYSAKRNGRNRVEALTLVKSDTLASAAF